jgi:nicotinate-nucleotide adenylyltransferase
MCELLLTGAPALAVCALEIERGGPSYTVDTLTAIHARHPDAHLTLIVGADIASTLPSWREPAKLLELADLAIASRPGSAREQVLDALARVPPGAPEAASPGSRVAFLEMPEIAISSSEARRRAGAGEPLVDLLGEAVARYVGEHRLYRHEAEGAG